MSILITMLGTIKLWAYAKLRGIICPFEKILCYIPNRGNVLDLGSGYGIFCTVLSKAKPDLKVLGIELDKKRVNIANKKYQTASLNFIAGDITKYTFDKKFDIVTCIDVFHHIPIQYHDTITSKLYENLKLGGRLIIKDMDDTPYYKYIWNYLHDAFVTRSLQMNYVSKKAMIDLVTRHGFSIQEVKDISNILYSHYLVVCERG